MYLTPKAEHHSCLPMPVLGRQGCQASRVSIAWQKVKPEMPPPQQQSRINLQDLKAQMVKRIGPERASQYFTYFKGYISLRYSKPDLDKRVVLTIGKENIGLHNQIIRAVLSNAVRCEDCPTVAIEQDNVKSTKAVSRKSSTLSNGDVSSVKDSSLKTTTLRDGSNEVDLCRPIQEIHGTAEQSKDDPNGRLGKRPRINSNFSSENNADSFRDGIGQVEIQTEDMYNQSLDGVLIKAPFGVQYINQRKPGMVGLAGMLSEFLLASDDERNFFEMTDLPDEETLQRHMEYIAASEGLQGINQDCVKILSQGLDIFLKQLITSCVKYVKSNATSQFNSMAKKEEKDQFHGQKNEQISENKFHVSNRSGNQKITEGSHATVSLNEFMSAMELNPEQLGEAWPLQIEKILLRAMD